MEHGHDEYSRAQTGDGRPRVAGALAAIRSMLTHPDATAEVRSAMAAQRRQAAEHLAEDDVELRAGLLGALTIGVVIGRHLLHLDGSPERITALLRPAFHGIAQGRPEPEATA
ncbi:TetR/AcrR family transcriptional regulator [Nocardia niigatensis]